ncbi:MAG: rhodanese-like domain-containing protein [Desulfobulbaceae bacterium]|nr:rhodanese-like domain-containing protein [Desulfobulbaceae bacterium]
MAKGYSEVYYFPGGIPEWRYFNYPLTIGEKWQKIKVAKIPPLEFKEILDKDKDIFLLDVRSLDQQTLNQQDYVFTMDNSTLAGNYIPGARHCPLVYLEQNYRQIPKNRRIIIADWIMKQSTIAAKFLTMQGYDVIGVLKGGTTRWQQEGLPIIQGEDNLRRQLLCE